MIGIDSTCEVDAIAAKCTSVSMIYGSRGFVILKFFAMVAFH